MPLLLRPLAILLEGYFLKQEDLLITVLPIAMIALAVSSIPIHIPMMKLRSNHPDWPGFQRRFLAALSIITLAVALALTALVLFFQLWVVASIILLFIIEKLADENCRLLEFEKSFVKWFYIQTIRSAWPILAIGTAALFGGYSYAFILTEIVTGLLLFGVFRQKIREKPKFDSHAVYLIMERIPYTLGGVLAAIFRNCPRIYVVQTYPATAHIFMSMAQIAQGASIMFDLRFSLPYRKLIAMKPTLYFKHMQILIRGIAFAGIIGATTLWMLPISHDLKTLPSEALLFALLITESGMLSMGLLLLSIVPWNLPIWSAVQLYSQLLGVYGIAAAIFFTTQFYFATTIFDVPFGSITVAFVWIFCTYSFLKRRMHIA